MNAPLAQDSFHRPSKIPFYPESQTEDSPPPLYHIFVSNLAGFVRSHALPDSIRTHIHSAGFQEILIEQWERKELLEEERLQLIRLQERYGEVVVTSATDTGDSFVHDCSVEFHEITCMRRTTFL
ncbi:hypothetical protein K439DRAFT_921458 [Ramaria rubella]|nr:hypothetical protein K439DRAFT_921458 [Ramaria rubella]